MRIFSINDSAVNAFMRPFFSQSDGAAIREFQDLVNGPDHPVAKHPEDYTLFVLADFDDQTGEIHAFVPKSLGNGVTFKLLAHGEQAAIPLSPAGLHGEEE